MISGTPIRVAYALLIAGAVGVAACGRSERIGWSDREMPESIAPAAAAETDAPPPAPESSEALLQEYQELAASLAPVQMQAMSDSPLAATWNRLNSEVEAEILKNSQFHRGLVARRTEIEALMQAEMSEEKLTDAERAELARHYRNIQVEMARARNLEFQKPEYAARLRGFQAALFDKMAQLQPGRASDIARMRQLEMLLFVTQDEDTAPPVPNLRRAPGRGSE